MRPARRRSRAPTAMAWCRGCAPTAIAASFRSTVPNSSRGSSPAWRRRAITWSASAPARSRSGPTRCRANSRPWARHLERFSMRRAELWSELMKLTPAERIDLAQDLWDSIAQHDLAPLGEEEKEEEELERRLEEHRRDPSTAITWEE